MCASLPIYASFVPGVTLFHSLHRCGDYYYIFNKHICFLRLQELVDLEPKVLQSHLSVMKKMPKFWMRSKIALKSMLVNSPKKSISHHTVNINLMNLFIYEYSCNNFVISVYQWQVMNSVRQSCREYLHHSLLVIISSLRIPLYHLPDILCFHSSNSWSSALIIQRCLSTVGSRKLLEGNLLRWLF